MKKWLLSAALVLLTPVTAQAQQVVIEDARKPDFQGEMALYPSSQAPDAEQWTHMVVTIGGSTIDSVAARNVTHPTLIPFLPAAGTGTGAAVIVAPGGAFLSLAMDGEGTKVAQWFAKHGVAAFVLKYRLNPTPRDNQAFLAALGKRFAGAANGSNQDAKEPRATEDALAALALVRGRAKDWGIDPHRVGMIGFSAGAQTAKLATLGAPAGGRPDFLGYVYGPMEAVAVPADAPPMFAALAMDDGLFGGKGFGIVDAWHKAGGKVELHAYQTGDHGFGAGRPGTTTMGLLPQFLDWLELNRFVPRQPD
ncbi:alpha/beta hydrolase fold domain-containing protein [Novosphingobium profundi]|uniref:alpha/beta hydrolase n=1 Tax=Novosphingobium profundi TaxID=1774954 RepID=UPI001BDA5097|nr:alpha/beta hydrolase fold domain-containing protein [Novosphingobium profundi]MBT0670137.1 alpha/beta hydrolase fold domain-containing protein [Novosphingobium profundi]